MKSSKSNLEKKNMIACPQISKPRSAVPVFFLIGVFPWGFQLGCPFYWTSRKPQGLRVLREMRRGTQWFVWAKQSPESWLSVNPGQPRCSHPEPLKEPLTWRLPWRPGGCYLKTREHSPCLLVRLFVSFATKEDSRYWYDIDEYYKSCLCGFG